MYLAMRVKVTLWVDEPQEGLGGCKILDGETVEMIAELPVHRDDYDSSISLSEVFWDYTQYIVEPLPAIDGKVSANIYLKLEDERRIAKYLTPEYPAFRVEFTVPDGYDGEDEDDQLEILRDVFWEDSRYDVERTQ